MNKVNYSVYVATAIIAMIMVFLNLGGIPLLDPDEPVYAETPREMILSGDFVSPQIYGDYWYDKPPMYYWLVAASYKIFGIHEFAARFPAAFLSVLCVIVVLFFVSKIFNKRTGIMSALILATSLEYFYLGKAAVTDITLNLFLTCSLLGFIHKKYYWFYVFAALATVTKGPIGLFFPCVIVLLYLCLSRNLKELKNMKIFSGILVFMLIALPWYGVMYHLHGNDFINTFLGFHNITRFTTPEHPTGVLWYYYIPVLFIGFFPWIAILFQSIYHSFVCSYEKFNILLFFNIWMLVVFLFFTVAQTKLVSYILPMYPAMAIIIGWYINSICNNYHSYKRQYSWSLATIVLAVLFSVGAFIGVKQMPQIENGVLGLVACFIFIAIGNVYSMWRRQIQSMFTINVVGMILISVLLSYSVFPSIAPQFSSIEISRQFTNLYDQRSPIYVSKFLRPGFAFYSNHYGQELMFSKQSIPDIDVLIEKNQQAYFILRDIDYNRLKSATKEKLKTLKVVDNKMILSIQN